MQAVARPATRARDDDESGREDDRGSDLCPSRLSRSAQVESESTAALFYAQLRDAPRDGLEKNFEI